MFTLEVAEQLARRVLTQMVNQEGVGTFDHTIERSFGWVFVCERKQVENKNSEVSVGNPVFFVNKHSGQILVTSSNFAVQDCIETYEQILLQLKMVAESWCTTLGGWYPQVSKESICGELRKVGLRIISIPETENDDS